MKVQERKRESVITVAIRKIPSLATACPIRIEVIIKPTLGKTKLHQLRWDHRSVILVRTAAMAEVKNQKLNPHKNIDTLNAVMQTLATNIIGSPRLLRLTPHGWTNR